MNLLLPDSIRYWEYKNVHSFFSKGAPGLVRHTVNKMWEMELGQERGTRLRGLEQGMARG